MDGSGESDGSWEDGRVKTGIVLGVLVAMGAGLGWLAGAVGPGVVLRAVAAGAGPGVLFGVIGRMKGQANGWTLLLVLVLWGLAGCGVWWLVGLLG